MQILYGFVRIRVHDSEQQGMPQPWVPSLAGEIPAIFRARSYFFDLHLLEMVFNTPVDFVDFSIVEFGVVILARGLRM